MEAAEDGARSEMDQEEEEAEADLNFLDIVAAVDGMTKGPSLGAEVEVVEAALCPWH